MPYYDPTFLCHNTDHWGFQQFSSPGQALCDPRIRTADNVVVKKIIWGKRDVYPRHEFLVVHVADENDSKRNSVVLIERLEPTGERGATQPPAPRKIEERKTSECNLKSKAHASPPKGSAVECSRRTLSDGITYSSSLQISTAEDELTFSTKGNADFVGVSEGGHTYAATLDLTKPANSDSSTPKPRLLALRDKLTKSSAKPESESAIGPLRFTLHELIVLAEVIHEEHREYDLMKYQCYWYAGYIYSVVKTICGSAASESQGPAFDLRGKFPLGLERTLVPAFSFSTISSGQTQAFKDKFDDQWAQFKKEIEEERREREKVEKERYHDAARLKIAELERKAEEDRLKIAAMQQKLDEFQHIARA